MEGSKEIVETKEKGFFDILHHFFRSLKLTIFLLIFLSLVSIIGTVITQHATKEEYLHRYGVSLYEVLNFFSLFDMYQSWWFTLILLCLVVNLMACSMNRLPGVWRQISSESDAKGLDDGMIKALANVSRVRCLDPVMEKEEKDVQHILKKRFADPKRIETERAVTFSSEKGRYSRLGVYVVHLSILVILIGGLIGTRFGMKGAINIFEGETVEQIYVRTKDGEIPRPIGFSLRCDDFQVTFYDLPGRERHVKEYTSTLTILEQGKEILKKKVEVNHPLHYKGLAFYQASYGAAHEVTLGIQSKKVTGKMLLSALEGEAVPVPDSGTVIQVLRYNPQVHTLGEGVQVALLRANQRPQTLWLFKSSPQGNQQTGDGLVLSFEDVNTREYTGLQVAKDPGVWVVWVGCGLLVFGLWVCFFFSHQRVWVRIPRGEGRGLGGEIVFAGSANKNRISFERSFDRLIHDVCSSLRIPVKEEADG